MTYTSCDSLSPALDGFAATGFIDKDGKTSFEGLFTPSTDKNGDIYRYRPYSINGWETLCDGDITDLYGLKAAFDAEGYWEAQYHGHLTLDDVDRLEITEYDYNNNISRAAKEELKKYGIKVVFK